MTGTVKVLGSNLTEFFFQTNYSVSIVFVCFCFVRLVAISFDFFFCCTYTAVELSV